MARFRERRCVSGQGQGVVTAKAGTGEGYGTQGGKGANRERMVKNRVVVVMVSVVSHALRAVEAWSLIRQGGRPMRGSTALKLGGAGLASTPDYQCPWALEGVLQQESLRLR